MILYACKCHSVDLYRVASESINRPDVFPSYDTVSCSACGYDGRYYLAVEVDQITFDRCIDQGQITEDMAARATEVTLR